MWFRTKRQAKKDLEKTLERPEIPYFNGNPRPAASMLAQTEAAKPFSEGWVGEEWAWLTGPKGGGTTLYYLKKAIDEAIAKGAPLNTPVEQIDAKVTESGHRDAINLFVKTGKEFNTKAHNEALLKANRKQIKKTRAKRNATKGLVPGQGVASKTPPAPANATNS